MAMLAEKRRKSKFVLNPISKPLWSKESSQFGRKMMEKMGWTAGKGLGAAEQGIQEPIRALYKQDSKGVGYSGQGNPFENLDQFNALLTSLSGTSTSEDVAHSFESLEEKSKHSRSRVHYKKFTRSKDVSRYSNMDLSCIVGVGKSVEAEVTEEEEEDHTGEEEISHGVTTINSGSLSEYFKLKMSQRKNISLKTENSDKYDHETLERRTDAIKNTANNLEDGAKEENSIEANQNNAHKEAEDLEKKAKKKKTSKNLNGETFIDEGCQPQDDASYPDDKNENYAAPILKEKKKKRHRKDKECSIENKEEPLTADEVTYKNEKKHSSSNKEHKDFHILRQNDDFKETNQCFTPRDILEKSKRRTEEIIEEKKIKKESKESSDCTISSKKHRKHGHRIDCDNNDHETFDEQEVNFQLANDSGSCKKKKKSHKSEKRKEIVNIAEVLTHKKKHHHKERDKDHINKEELEQLQSQASKIPDEKIRKKCKSDKNISEEITAPNRKKKKLEKENKELNENCDDCPTLIKVDKEKKGKTKSIEKGSNKNKMDGDLSVTNSCLTGEKKRKLESNEVISHTEVDLRKDEKSKRIEDLSLFNGSNQECAEISKRFKGSNLGTFPGYGQRR